MPLNLPGGPGMGIPNFGGPAMGAIGVGIIPPNVPLFNKGVMPQNMMNMGNTGIPPMGGMMNVTPQMGETNPKTKL